MSVFNTVESSIATHYFKQNQLGYAKVLNRISSGNRLSAVADAGALSVSLTMNSSKSQLKSIQQNIQNSIAYLEVQDGLMETAGNIFLRVQELYGLYQADPLKAEDGIEKSLYNIEFNGLQSQIEQIYESSFNGNALFVKDIGPEGEELSVRISPDGDQEIKFKRQDLDYSLGGILWDVTSLDDIDNDILAIDLEDFSTIRSENASSRKQLSIIAESLSIQDVATTNAMDRLESIDLAYETALLAKSSMLLQSSMSVLSQANSNTDRVEALLKI